MAMQINGGGRRQMSEINVTPLVDVMLVLLIIFMVTAPLMLNGIKLTLPKTREVNKVNLTANQVILSYTKNGSYYLGKQKVSQNYLVEMIKKKFTASGANVLYLRADYQLRYGKIAKLMSLLKSEGIANIALVTQKESN
jgi:biopolymer transport protein ExbD